MAKVKVKLAARCIVDRQTCEAGDIVEIDEAIAESFGEVQGKAGGKSAEPKKDEK